ncbi:hypothetical protein [Pseudomonas sp. PLMAX]|uniref:hypothetical protein n=1 Tax=Pseudomonas sp. PLMAX TaxID=2201998 RepID=UPI0038B98DE0
MTVLVGMHLGTHTILISDKRLSETGSMIVNDTQEKLKVAMNHAAVKGGSHALGTFALNHIKDKDISNGEDVAKLSEALLKHAQDPFGDGTALEHQRTALLIASTAEERAKLFYLDLVDLPNGGRVREQRELLKGQFEIGIPAGLSKEEGMDLRAELAEILNEFMATKAHTLNPGNTKGLTELLFSVGKVLTRLAETTPSISSLFDVGVKSSTGLTVQGQINFKKRRVVNLNQLMEKRWEYEVDGYTP